MGHVSVLHFLRSFFLCGGAKSRKKEL